MMNGGSSISFTQESSSPFTEALDKNSTNKSSIHSGGCALDVHCCVPRTPRACVEPLQFLIRFKNLKESVPEDARRRQEARAAD